MADNLLYEMSTMTENLSEPFVKKEIVWISDSNGGSYNGQIIFETSSLANSGKWVSWNEAIIELPIVYAFESTQDLTASTNNPYMLGTKCGWHQFIDSVQIDYNNTNVVQITSYTNFYVSFKMMTTWSQDDVAKYGALLNFFPDTSNSFRYAQGNGDSSDGNGISNNRIANVNQFNANTGLKSETNQGFYKRLVNCGHDANAGLGGCYTLLSSTQLSTIAKSQFKHDSGTGAARVYYWSVLGKVFLKNLADFFDKIPLVKGAFLKIVLNTNTATTVVNHVANSCGTNTNTGSLFLNATGNNTITGRTNPLMIASANGIVLANSNVNAVTTVLGAPYANPLQTIANSADGNVWIGCGIGSVTIHSHKVDNAILTQARIYVPAYTLNPTFEDQLLSLHPTKDVVYRDIYQYTITGVTTGGSINQLLTNGISNPKALIILPFISGTAGATGNATTPTLSPYQSPFTSEPHTTSPYLSISDFNIQISGINLWNENKNMDWDMFLNEIKGINAVNGGLTQGLTSGLIGEADFSSGYRYYVADLSRRLPLEDTVAKSIQVIGKNNSAKTVDYFCFIEYQRSITIDMATGAIIPQ